MSSDFDRFASSLALSYRDADWFDTEALGRLVGEERARAEELLIELLRTHRDIRALGALEVLQTPSAHAAIREALAGPNAELVAHAAGAILHEDPAAALEGVRRALGSPDDSAQACAVQVLRRLSGAEAEAELLGAIDSPAKNARVLATEAIFDKTGLGRFEVPRRGVSLLRMRLTSDSQAIRHAALAELRGLMDQLKQGRSPEDLGLAVPAPEKTPALERFLDSRHRRRYERDAEDYDLSALDALDPEDRTWAELALIDSLADFDHRVPRALLHMGSRPALEPLLARARALLTETGWTWPARPPGSTGALDFRSQGLFYVELARAVWHLGGLRREAEDLLRRVEAHPDPDVRARARTALA